MKEIKSNWRNKKTRLKKVLNMQIRQLKEHQENKDLQIT